MRDQDEELSTVKFLAVAVIFAPVITLFVIALPPSDDHRDDLYLYSLLVGGNLLYVSIAGLLFIFAQPIGEAALSFVDAAVELWALYDPKIVWEPWQAVGVAIAIACILIVVGGVGMLSRLRTYSEGGNDA